MEARSRSLSSLGPSQAKVVANYTYSIVCLKLLDTSMSSDPEPNFMWANGGAISDSVRVSIPCSWLDDRPVRKEFELRCVLESPA